MANSVVIFYGPHKAFQDLLDDRIKSSETTVSYLDSIRIYNSRIRASELASSGPKPSLPEAVDNCIVRTNDFGSVLSHVISSFGSILEETFEIDTLYVQNPPKRARASIEAFHDPSQIEVINYPYPALSKKRFRAFLRTWKNRYLGRKNARNQYCQPCTGYRF